MSKCYHVVSLVWTPQACNRLIQLARQKTGSFVWYSSPPPRAQHVIQPGSAHRQDVKCK